MLTERLGLRADDPRLLELAGRVVSGQLDALAAAQELIAGRVSNT
jgi:hypothetical protein